MKFCRSCRFLLLKCCQHTINLYLSILPTLTFIVACAVNMHACMFNHYQNNQFENNARKSQYSNSAVISGVVAVDEGTTFSVLANLDQLRLIRAVLPYSSLSGCLQCQVRLTKAEIRYKYMYQVQIPSSILRLN